MDSRDEAFTAFVERAGPQLGRTAVMLAGTRHAGEDLLQEALVRTYLAWPRIDEAAASAYVRRVMANLTTDRWRRRHLEPVASLEQVPEPVSPRPGERLVDDRDQVVRELATLSARERTVVVLRYYHDLSEKQVAEELGVSLGTVKSTASRALARLREAASTPAPESQERSTR